MLTNDEINKHNDVSKKVCMYRNCSKHPCFNYINKKNGIYCFDHKLENMINVQRKKCEQIGCIKGPKFNQPDKTKGVYCFEHKLENMVNVVSKKMQL